MYKQLFYSMIISALRENDYQFFSSDYYQKKLKDFLPVVTQEAIDKKLVEWKKEREENIYNAMQIVNSIVDKDFQKVYNFFVA